MMIMYIYIYTYTYIHIYTYTYTYTYTYRYRYIYIYIYITELVFVHVTYISYISHILYMIHNMTNKCIYIYTCITCNNILHILRILYDLISMYIIMNILHLHILCPRAQFPDVFDRRARRLHSPNAAIHWSCSRLPGKTFFFQSEFKYTQGEVSKPWTWQKVPHAAAWQNMRRVWQICLNIYVYTYIHAAVQPRPARICMVR